MPINSILAKFEQTIEKNGDCQSNFYLSSVGKKQTLRRNTVPGPRSEAEEPSRFQKPYMLGFDSTEATANEESKKKATLDSEDHSSASHSRLFESKVLVALDEDEELLDEDLVIKSCSIIEETQDPTETAFTVDSHTRLFESSILEELRKMSSDEDSLASDDDDDDDLADELEQMFLSDDDVLISKPTPPSRNKSFQTIAKPSRVDRDDSCTSENTDDTRACYMKWEDQIGDHIRRFRPKMKMIPVVRKGNIQERIKQFQ